MTTTNQPLVKNIDGQEASILTRMPLLDSGDVEAKRQEILEYFHNSFTFVREPLRVPYQ